MTSRPAVGGTDDIMGRASRLAYGPGPAREQLRTLTAAGVAARGDL